MKRRLIVYIGLALMVGLYLYDRDNSTTTITAASVVSVEDRDDNAGPDTWHITVNMAGVAVELEPRAARPDLSPDDKVCVSVITRMGRKDEHRLAPAGTEC